jgi:hypothetical protein
MQLMQMTPGQTQLAILLLSCFIVYYFYPEYMGVVIPLFVAITLHFSSDEMIVSMFDIIPIDMSMITDKIIQYKMYIMIALIIVAAYYGNELLKHKGVEHMSENSSDIFRSSSTEYKPPTPTPSDLDMEEMPPRRSLSRRSRRSIRSGLDM